MLFAVHIAAGSGQPAGVVVADGEHLAVAGVAGLGTASDRYSWFAERDRWPGDVLLVVDIVQRVLVVVVEAVGSM